MKKSQRGREISLSLAILAAAVLLLAGSDTAGEAAADAVKMCAAVLIPSLFPYMVISGMAVSLGAMRYIGRLCAPICRRVFRLPGVSAGAVLLGALCGFPIGAQTACGLYEERQLTRSQTERLIAIANNTGPAFVIEVVGAHCWGSRGFGIAVYLAQILSALCIGAVYARLTPKGPADAAEVHPHPVPQKDVLTCFAQAVSAAAASVLTVCGFVVFFAVVTEFLRRFRGSGPWFFPAAAILEFTQGTAAAAELGGSMGAFLTGFAVGWSGISVFAQCKVFTAPLGIRLTPAALCKGIQGLLTGLTAAVYYRFFFTRSALASTCIPVADSPHLLVLGEVFLLILFCIAPIFMKKRCRS